jgi:hypothetical protein
MMSPIIKLAGYIPLVYLADRIVLSRLNRLYIADLHFNNIEFVCSIGELNFIWRFFSRFRLVQRLLRLDMGPATPLKEKGCLLVFYSGKVFHVDINKRKANQEYVPGLSKNPLVMLLIQSGPLEGSVVFGDYCRNANYDSVNIYRRGDSSKWEIAYVFPKGEINHVHGIFEDASRKCLYLLTGDFDLGACIWVADMTLKDVRPMLRKGQMSRACWIVPRKENLIFATDQQEEFNYLCSVEGLEIKRIERHFPIAGSSIYFSRTHSDLIVFSTAVEPRPSNKPTLVSLLSTRRASGILSDIACIYAGTPEQGFDIIFSGKKDGLPFGLFQFGNIRFPDGKSSDEQYIHFYCSALRGHDGVAYAIKLTQTKSEKICVA